MDPNQRKLTKDEKRLRREQIFELLDQGLPNTEIARRLGIDLRVVTGIITSRDSKKKIGEAEEIFIVEKLIENQMISNQALTDALNEKFCDKTFSITIVRRARNELSKR